MWEAVMRTRFSLGFKITNFLTPVLISNGDLLVLPTLDSDQCYTMSIEPAETEGLPNVKQPSDPWVHIQTAILFTHSDGTRRIRIHNTCLPTTTKLFDVYDNIDVESLVTFYMKQTIDKIYKSKKISNAVLSTEATFKSLINSILSTQQTIKKELPEKLLYLPLYIMGMLKHRIMCKDEIDKKFDLDLSNYMRIKLQKLPLMDCMPFLYPRIYPLHSILEDNSIGNYDENEVVILPNVIRSIMFRLLALIQRPWRIMGYI